MEIQRLTNGRYFRLLLLSIILCSLIQVANSNRSRLLEETNETERQRQRKTETKKNRANQVRKEAEDIVAGEGGHYCEAEEEKGEVEKRSE